jgi:putative transposase
VLLFPVFRIMSPSVAMDGAGVFSDDDYRLYLRLLEKHCAEAHVTCQAYVLMPNHVHLILVPKTEDGLSKAMSLTHRTYASMLNARRKKSGIFGRGGLDALSWMGRITWRRCVMC